MKFKTLLLSSMILASTAAAAEPTHRLFATNEKDNTVSVIDSRTNKVETTIDIGQRPRGIGLSPDQTMLYVAISEDNAIAVVDVNTLEVVKTLDAGDDPETFGVNPVTGHIVISNEDDGE